MVPHAHTQNDNLNPANEPLITAHAVAGGWSEESHNTATSALGHSEPEVGQSTPESPESEQYSESVDANNPAEERTASVEVKSVQKKQTVPKSIRLWKSAFDALRALMAKYGKNMVDMASIAIIAYAKSAAAAPILRSRLVDDNTLFALQAAATDVRAGLSNLRNDLYEARKSHRNPERLQKVYAELSATYQARLKHADETLTLIDKECALHGLLAPSDRALLIQAVATLKGAKPKNRTGAQLRDLLIKIYNTLLR